MKISEFLERSTQILTRKLAEIRADVDSRVAPLEARIAALERCAGIEAKAAGPDDREYKAGDVASFGGARWLCRGVGRWRRLEDA